MTISLPYGAKSSIELATIIRQKRADFKARVARTQDNAMQHEMIATLVWLPPRWAATWRVRDVLYMVRYWGDDRVDAAMFSAAIQDPNRTLHTLTTRQATILAETIRIVGVSVRAESH
jgi:hypothetical protein